MISPHTPPGTIVVCRERSGGGPLPKLRVGATYTIAEMVETDDDDIGVHLVETSAFHARRYFDGWKIWTGLWHWSYDRGDFDLAVLPRCLTEIAARSPFRKARTKALA